MAIPMAWAAIPTGDPPSPRGFLHPHVCAAIPRCEPAIPRCERPSPGVNPPSPRVSGHPHVCAAIPRCERPSPRVGGHPQFVKFCLCGPFAANMASWHGRPVASSVCTVVHVLDSSAEFVAE